MFGRFSRYSEQRMREMTQTRVAVALLVATLAAGALAADPKWPKQGDMK
jgi:hypothetical protein